MSLLRLEVCAVRAPRARPIAWGALLAGVLVAEVVVLTTRFDAVDLAVPAAWKALLPWVTSANRLAIAVGGAMVLVVGLRLGAGPGRAVATGEASGPGRGWPYLLAHVVLFACLVPLTGAVWARGLGGAPGGAGWGVAWLVAVASCAATWGAAVAPARVWVGAAWRGRGAVALGGTFGLLAWAASRGTGRLWEPLGRATFWAVEHLLRLVRADVVCRPEESLIGAASFVVHVGRPCSGYEGIGLIWVFLGAFLWCSRRSLRFPRALVLLPLGTAVIWLANAARIALLVLIGAGGAPGVAVGGFHSQAGWLAFNGVALGLVVVARRWRFVAADADADANANENPTAAYLVPLLALVAAVMMTAAVSDGFDWLYPLRVAAVGVALWTFRRSYGRTPGRGVAAAPARPRWSWGAVALGALAFAVWMALEPWATSPEASRAASEAMARGLAGLPRVAAVAWLAARVIGSVVTVPIAEELAFRGYLVRRLIARRFEDVPIGRLTGMSLLISSALFGALHGRWLAGTLAGVIYAVAVSRRGVLADAVVAHATTNALIAALAIATGAWSLWA